MPVLSAERFATGMTWDDYLASCTKHIETRQRGHESVTFTPEHEQALQRLNEAQIKVLVLEEDWCGDAARSGPILARIAEAANIEARWFLRDQNLDIMDQFLENGTSRAIPVFVFMDQNREFLCRWGSRPEAVKAAVQHLLPLPPQDDPARLEAFERFREAVGEAYARIYPMGIVDEILEQVTNALPSFDDSK